MALVQLLILVLIRLATVLEVELPLVLPERISSPFTLMLLTEVDEPEPTEIVVEESNTMPG